VRLAAVAVAALTLAAAACDDDKEAVPGPTSTESGTFPGLEALPGICGELQQGDEPPEMLVWSDFPLQGRNRPWTVQANKAIAQVFDDHDWRAGGVPLGLQECDDSTAVAGRADAAKCSTNAGVLAQSAETLAVVGLPDTWCAAVEVPVLAQGPGGGVPVVGLASGMCLTRDFGGCNSSKYRPRGTATYVRVVPSTLDQAAAVAQLAQREGHERIYVLDDASVDGREFARAFSNAAAELDLGIVGSGEWGREVTAAIAGAVRARPDAIVVAGEYDEDLLEEKVRRLGSNLDVPVFGSQAFEPPTRRHVNPAAIGVVYASPFVPPQLLPEAGLNFLENLLAGTKERTQFGSVYAAQAAEVALRAAEAGGGSSAATAAALFGMRIEDGLIGDFEIDEHGDAVGLPVALYRVQPRPAAFTLITPPRDLVEAAAG
jgi:branched-chain amino acid transport system substrate-binding protein